MGLGAPWEANQATGQCRKRRFNPERSEVRASGHQTQVQA